MSTPAAKQTTADEFLAWAEAQPQGRYELVDGQIISMAPERADHARGKGATWAALKVAIKKAGVPCEAFIDGLSVRINDSTVYEPDALVNCGQRIAGNDLIAPNPTIVVEVLSPSTQHIDKARKLIDYFSLPAIHHYILIDLERRAIVHHRRAADHSIATMIVRKGVISLDPPGISLDTAALLDTG